MADIDLNLLAVFEALYELRSATRAAQRLNLTQSAVSHALRRLRESVGDPLFVRSGAALQPTARAQAMAAGVSEGLMRLRSAMVPVAFDPATATRTFTVAAGSYFCALLIPRLVAQLRVVAPGIGLRIVPVGAALLADLDEGTVELALGAFARVPARLVSETLFREDLVWITAGTNPLGADRLAPAVLLSRPHLVIATRRVFEPIGALLAEGPLESRGTLGGGADATGPVPATVYDALTAAAIVAASDAVALVPRRLALSEAERLGLRIIEPADQASGIELGMLTHARAATDPGMAWLRSQVVDASR